MPVFLAWGKPNDVAWPNVFDWPAITLYPAASGSDNQRLSERMCVPRSACARLKGNACTSSSRRSGGPKKWVDADRSREPVRWTLLRGLRTSAFNVHCYSFGRLCTHHLRRGLLADIVTKAVIKQPSRSSSANEKPAKPARNSQQICNVGGVVLLGHGFADQWFSAPRAVARQARAEDAAGTCAQPATSIACMRAAICHVVSSPEPGEKEGAAIAAASSTRSPASRRLVV